MKRTGLVLIGSLLAGGALGEPHSCDVPDYLTHADAQLARVAAFVAKERRLDILVVGTGSSMLAGADGARNAYPARLEAALAKRLPGMAVTVRTDVKSRRTTADMVNDLQKYVLDGKPNLVVWQTGTADAIRGVDPDEFRAALEKGVSVLRAAGADVILVNMQYSPRTDAMITAGPYADGMRWVAQQQDLPLFDRLSVMKHWSEAGAFDLSGPNTGHMAEKVHNCLGKLLAELIVNAAHLNPNPSKEIR
jgi:lysophospholipase L1-like esterase